MVDLEALQWKHRHDGWLADPQMEALFAEVRELRGNKVRNNTMRDDLTHALIVQAQLEARVAELERLGDHLLNAIREHTEVYLDGGESLSHAEEAWRKALAK